MKLKFYTEARFVRGKEGVLYNEIGVQKYSLLSRYLSVFSLIEVYARVIDDPNFIGVKDNLIEGPGVKVIPLPYYIGPYQYLQKKKKIEQIIKSNIEKGSAYLLRLPGNIGNIVAPILYERGISYSVEVVGDPFDVFSKGGVKSLFRIYFKWKGYFDLKKNVSKASTALYVTEKKLQSRYPLQKGKYSVGISDVIIKKSDLRLDLSFPKNGNPIKLISIGSLEQMYKGPDILLKSMSKLKQLGYDCKLQWIGGGRYLEDMKRMSGELGLQNDVTFLGFVADKKIINEYLDKSDIFILASRTEGLPRVIIEAFARSLPVIASNVGGIPELVNKDQLFIKEDVADLCRVIARLIDNKTNFLLLRRENYVKALRYEDSRLDITRKEFFEKIKEESYINS